MVSVEQKYNTTKVKHLSWLIDSGCTNQITVDVRLFRKLDRNYESKVRIANGEYMEIEEEREIEVETI